MSQRFVGLFLAVIMVCLGPACSKHEEAQAPADKPVPVEVRLIKAVDLPRVASAVGRLAANREVTLSAEIGGVVAEYLADVGDVVEADQVLVQLDRTDYQLALKEARSGLAQAQAHLAASSGSHERSKSLLPRQVISTDSFEKSEAEYKSSAAACNRARTLVEIGEERLKKTVIKAPFGGLVAARTIEKGQTVAPGQPAMTIVDLGVVRVNVSLGEKDYVDLDPDDPVTVLLDAYPGREFKGRVDRIGVKADHLTNTFGVEVLVDNPNLELKAGLTARVRITTSMLTGVILIPQSTLLYREDHTEVFVVGADNRAETRTVTLGRADGGLIQVEGGLVPGDKLVVNGAQYLKSGSELTVSLVE
jgi:RND family efflux transporter MFP subunit